MFPVSVMTFDVLLKVSSLKGTTKRAKLINGICEDGSVHDVRILQSNACLKCSEDVPSDKVIECLLCNEKYHIPCLTHSIPADFITQQFKNPCLWWFCSSCVADAKVADAKPGKEPPAKEICDKDPVSKVISEGDESIIKQLSVMKCEMLNELNKTIESKLENVLSQLAEKSLSVKAPVNQVCCNVEDTSSPLSSPLSTTRSWEPLNKPGEEPCVNSQTQERAPETVVGEPEVLILSPEDGVNVSDVLLNKVKKSVETKLKRLPVEFVRPNSNSKKIALGFKTSELRTEAESLINSDNDLASSGYTCKPVNKMLPKISLFNVSSDVFDEVDRSSEDEDQIKQLEKLAVIEKILDKNDDVRALHSEQHTLQVVYLKKITEHQYTIVLKVSPAIRAALIKQGRRIYVGSTVHYFTDRFHVQQCYHCQKIGHTSGKCPEIASAPVCMYCMGKHKSSNCTPDVKKNPSVHRCARCLASTHGNDAELGLTHNAASPNCPLIKRELKRLEQNTNFTSKNAM